RADAFFLSSRLDPLPNVAIDGALRGIPMICFESASGLSEILGANPATCEMVVPYLDALAAARRIELLMDDKHYRERVGEAIRTQAAELFDMQQYADGIDRLGREAVSERRQVRADFQVIGKAGVF